MKILICIIISILMISLIVLATIGITSLIRDRRLKHSEGATDQLDDAARMSIVDDYLNRGICPITTKTCRAGGGLNDQPLPCPNCRLFAMYLEMSEDFYEKMEDYSK